MTPIILIGGSVRAAAWSYRRAGMEPFAIDLFNDTDLKAMAESVRIPFEDYPNGFLHMLDNAPPGSVFYTGGLENHPDLIDAIAAKRQILGNKGEALRRIRDPFQIESVLRSAGLAAIECQADRPAGGDWLWKPFRGAAGDGIRRATVRVARPDQGYHQRFQAGEPHSAIFVAHPDRVELLGVTRQLIGEPWLDATPFRYAGNIGPVDVSKSLDALLGRIGSTLGRNLQGLFGVDFLLDADIPYVCEVNPRYTAAVEVLERATGQSYLCPHLRAFGVTLDEPKYEPPGICGKAVLYASQSIQFPGNIDTADLADIPAAGEPIDAGWPVCTILAQGKTGEEVLARLKEHAAQLKLSLTSAGQAPSRPSPRPAG